MNEIDKILEKIEDKKIVYTLKKMIDKFLICPQKELAENYGMIRGALTVCYISNYLPYEDVDCLLKYLAEIAFNRYKHRI